MAALKFEGLACRKGDRGDEFAEVINSLAEVAKFNSAM
jgi:hypothetical protein